MSKFRILLASALLVFSVSAVRASDIQITGSGTWASSTNPSAGITATVATTPWSAPGGTWAFTLTLADPTLVVPDGSTTGAFQTFSILGWSYTLNGSPVNVTGEPPAVVVWYPNSASQGVYGGFDIDFGPPTTNISTAPLDTFNVVGNDTNQVFFTTDSSGNFTGLISPATYNNILVDFDLSSQCNPPSVGCGPTDTGTGIGNITVSTVATVTPEPGTLMLLASGVVGLIIKRRK
jgi:hypothetical protein